MPGCKPMHWHSDWSGRTCDPVACVACSICLVDQDPQQAPMMAIPADKTSFFAGTSGSGVTPLGSELNHAVRLCPKAGQVLIRNVVAWHGGSANDTVGARYLPCLRFCMAAAWEDGTWRGPARVLPAAVKNKYQLSTRWNGVVCKDYSTEAKEQQRGEANIISV